MPLFQTMADRNVRPTRVLDRRLVANCASHKPRRGVVLVRAALAVLAGGLLCANPVSSAFGATVYWDTNGATPGAVNTAGSPANGIWGANANWNPVPEGTSPTAGWVSGETAAWSKYAQRPADGICDRSRLRTASTCELRFVIGRGCHFGQIRDNAIVTNLFHVL